MPRNHPIELPLILGGHSFITQLGNDPAADVDTQLAIVRACLDHGITWIDTTYQPERVALGHVLHKMSRRAELKIIVWNFFQDFDSKGELGGPDYYQPHHLQQMLDQLQTDHIDALVIHWIGAAETNHAQEELALKWVADGRVKQLGIWGAPTDALIRYRVVNPYSFLVRPANISTPAVAEQLAWSRSAGWRNFATSPFVRGWHLEKLLIQARKNPPPFPLTPTSAAQDPDGPLRATLANLMLRHALYLPNVDRLIVAMRKPEWVEKNAQAALQGVLSPAENQWLHHLQSTL